jgi:hypothetical protein
MADDPSFDTLTVDTLLLAGHAEVRDRLLYIEAGGIDIYTASEFDRPFNLCLAGNVLVPWSAVVRPHEVSIHVEDDDGRMLRDPLGLHIGALEIPSRATPGQAARQPFAFRFACPIPGPGTYAVVARMAGAELRRVTFQVRRPDEILET